MRLYKPRAGGKWYIDFADHTCQRRRIAAFTSKAVSQEFAGKLQAIIDRIRAGLTPDDPSVVGWLRRLPDETLEKLAQWDLIPRQYAQTLRPIEEHIRDYLGWLKSRGRCADYIGKMRCRLNAIASGCGFRTFRDITPARLQTYLETLRQQGYSATTCRHYQDSLNVFLNWAASNEGGYRIPANPLQGLTKPQRNDKKRGILTPDQFARLLQTTSALNIVRSNVSGYERAILYLLAAATGLRRQELLSLRWADLRLDEQTPYVLARAETTKNKQAARQPLPAGVAETLRHFKQHSRKPTSDTAFVFTFGGRWIATSEWLKADLQAAGLPLTDKEGREIRFHSLRNFYISLLANQNLPVKIIQRLARHSDPRLTLNTYARTLPEAEQNAIKTLPDFGRFLSDFCVATSVAKLGEKQRIEANEHEQQNLEIAQKMRFLANPSIAPRGFEPLAEETQAQSNQTDMDFGKSAVATGVAKKNQSVAIFEILQARWDTLPESTQTAVYELLKKSLEGLPDK